MASQLEQEKGVAQIIGGQLLLQNSLIQKAKSDLTYETLVDLSSLNSENPSEKESKAQPSQDLAQRKTKLLDDYVQAINKLDELYAEQEIQAMKKSIAEYRVQIEKQENEFVQNRTMQLIEIQQKLNSLLKTFFKDIQEYIRTVALKVKHLKFLNEERQIDEYLQRQKEQIEEQRGDIERIIRNKNDEIRKFIHIAKDVCRQKQTEIDQLKQQNQQNQKKLQNTISSIQGLNQKEKETYTNIANLSQEILQIKAQNKTKVRQNKTFSQKSSQNQANFGNQNLGSEIILSRESSIEPSSILLTELSSSESKPSAKCEILGTDFKTELMANKAIILVLLILSLVLFLW